MHCNEQKLAVWNTKLSKKLTLNNLQRFKQFILVRKKKDWAIIISNLNEKNSF
jgi:hypothetical protein